MVLLHGDYGYHNVLQRGSGGYCLIDWELAGFGDPRLDVGNLLFWTHLHFLNIARACTRCFLEGYEAVRPLGNTPDTIHAAVICQIWRIIGLVRENFSEAVKTEWNRRLSWALNHTFI